MGESIQVSLVLFEFIWLVQILFVSQSTLMSWMNQSEHGKEFMVELSPEDAYRHDSGPYMVYYCMRVIQESRCSLVWTQSGIWQKTSWTLPIPWRWSSVWFSALPRWLLAFAFPNRITSDDALFRTVPTLFRFFHSPIETYTVFIPQMIFMGAIFVYLCIQIVLKWLFFWVTPGEIFGWNTNEFGNMQIGKKYFIF